MSGRVNTRRIRDRNKRLLTDSDTCGLCGHAGSDAIDHVIPLARGGADDESNLQPAHHDTPCPTCGIKCNRVKGDKLNAPIIRRSSSITW